MMKLKWQNLFFIILCSLIILGGYKLIMMFKGVIYPTIISFLVVVMLNPLTKLLKKKFSNTFTSLIVFLIFLSIICIFVFVLIPLLCKEIIDVTPVILNVINNINNYFDTSIIGEFIPKIDQKFIYDILSKIDIFNGSIIVIDTIISYILPTLLFPTLMFYWLLYYDDVERWIKSFNINKDTYNAFKESKEAIISFGKGFFIIIMLMIIISSLSYLIIGANSFLLYGTILGLTDIIPYFGPYIGGAIISLLILEEDKALFPLSLIIIFGIQALEGLVLTPKIQGKKLQLNPILVIFLTLILGEIFGVFGVVGAVLIGAIGKIWLNWFFLRIK